MKYEAQKITEEELEMVTGGSKPGYQTTNSSTYSSGDMPKYKIGDKVLVKYIPLHFANREIWQPFRVTGVSSSKDGGVICKEYTYTLEFDGDGDSVLTGVYESCLRRA